MLQLLRRHPARVTDPDQASLFVLPLMPYISSGAGECMGETHEQRMVRTRSALLRSEHFRRNGGHDHLLITNTFRVKLFGPWFKQLLSNATVAWFEQPLLANGQRRQGTLYRLAFWRCTIVIPYLTNPFCALQREIDRPPHASRRAGSVFFQGSWSAAHNLRRHLKELNQLPSSHVHDVPRWHECQGSNQSKPDCVVARSRGSRLHTARGMLQHEFCLVPRGDTPTSGRLFVALACRCVPIVISNKFAEHFPYASRGRYDEWTVNLPEQRFMKAPMQSVEEAIANARPKLSQMREAMESVSTELLYDAPGSRAADNMLREWGRACAAADNQRQTRDPTHRQRRQRQKA